jgi:acetylornithine/succinyldiaminopimelate/putrescine aminotransferase
VSLDDEARAAGLLAYDRHVNPGRAALLSRYYGRAPVLAEREGARFRDAGADRWFLDCHCNGGIYNLGHRNPALVAALTAGLAEVDVGNAWLPSPYKGALGARLAASTGGLLDGVYFSTSGGEAVDIAIKVARGTTRRPVVISATGGYHGHTGLATATGTEDFRRPWHYDLPDFVQVPFDDLDALDRLVDDRTAVVLLETVPATLGMPIPSPGYLAAAGRLAHERGALLALDEVQTGLGRTGTFWSYQQDDAEPDMVISGKGLGGGLYPFSATLVRAELLDVLREHPFAQFASFAGSDLGCLVALTVLDILESPGFLDRVRHAARVLAGAFQDLPVEVRQRGLLFGLATGAPGGGVRLAQLLVEEGIWTVPAGNDPSVCQLLPPLTVTDAELDGLITAVRTACARLHGAP